MAIEHRLQARTAAGRLAVALANAHSPEIASDMMRGMLDAFVIATSEVCGRAAVLNALNEHLMVQFPQESKIRLVVNNSGVSNA